MLDELPGLARMLSALSRARARSAGGPVRTYLAYWRLHEVLREVVSQGVV